MAATILALAMVPMCSREKDGVMSLPFGSSAFVASDRGGAAIYTL